MTGRTLRLSALLAGSGSLLIVLAACGSKGGSTAEPQQQPLHSVSYGSFCPDFVDCINGLHWDPQECECVPNGDGGAGTDGAADGESPVEAGVSPPDASPANEASDDDGATTDASACDEH